MMIVQQYIDKFHDLMKIMLNFYQLEQLLVEVNYIIMLIHQMIDQFVIVQLVYYLLILYTNHFQLYKNNHHLVLQKIIKKIEVFFFKIKLKINLKNNMKYTLCNNIFSK
jgi:hypothetical protein